VLFVVVLVVVVVVVCHGASVDVTS
jgi:hypothetical protein